MTDLQSYFNSINESSNSLKTLYFRPPGIFTNALILKPDITTLLRDADNHENTLYHVDNQGKPERKDGTRGVLDGLNDEFDRLELQKVNLDEYANKNEGKSIAQFPDERPSVVLVPKELDDHDSSSILDHNKGVKNLLNKFTEENHDYDVDLLCETVRQLLQKYPIAGIEQDLEQYKARWTKLNEEIASNEDIIEKQRRQLSLLNISLQDRVLDTSSTKQQVQKKKNITELIEEEELEIRRLELELERKSKEVNIV